MRALGNHIAQARYPNPKTYLSSERAEKQLNQWRKILEMPTRVKSIALGKITTMKLRIVSPLG